MENKAKMPVVHIPTAAEHMDAGCEKWTRGIEMLAAALKRAQDFDPQECTERWNLVRKTEQITEDLGRAVSRMLAGVNEFDAAARVEAAEARRREWAKGV